jgi:hypothetical protein
LRRLWALEELQVHRLECKDFVLRLSGPAFGFPRHPFYEGTSRSLRRDSHGEKILTERLQRRRARDAKFRRGQLKSGRGGKGGTVKSRKQAIAIGLSEARKKGKKVPVR